MKHLGIAINLEGTLHSHLKHRLSYTKNRFTKLQHLWSHTKIDKHFKLKVYKAISPPMATHVLHYDWHISGTLSYIDEWHCKLLRRTLKWKDADRSKPKSCVYQQTKSATHSQNIAQQQNKFYAHIARAPGTLPYTTTFCLGQIRQIATYRTSLAHTLFHILF